MTCFQIVFCLLTSSLFLVENEVAKFEISPRVEFVQEGEREVVAIDLVQFWPVEVCLFL